MSIRHNAHLNSLDKLYSSQWNDEHMPYFLNTRLSIYDPITQIFADVWSTVDTVGGTAPDVSNIAGQPVVVLNTGGTTDKTSVMKMQMAGSASNITDDDNVSMLELHVTVVAIHSVGNVAEWGLLNSTVVPFTANQDGAYFRVADNNLYAVCGTGAAETTYLIGNYVQDSRYRIRRADNGYEFYVGDTDIPTATITTNLPDSGLTVKVAVRSKNNVDSTIYCEAAGLETLCT